MATQQPNKLPKKEAEQFRLLVDCYEKKNYKKGIKTADSILKKFPNSGETQAMKGIILNALGKKEEAYELIKIGLKNDVRSHICWHVYGLIYRSDNNYKEAIKCYLNALRIDPGNQNILRDLSWLQIQMRDFQGFLNSRRKILESKSTARASWVAFAAANFWVKDFNASFDVVSKYIENVSEKGDQYEESELILFQNMCLIQQSKFIEALEHLEKNQHLIVDKLARNVKKAELLTLSSNFGAALEEWEALVKLQPENYHFHRGLQATLLSLSPALCREAFGLSELRLPCNYFVLSSENKKTLLEWYSHHSFKSRAVEKILLCIYIGEDEFEQKLSSYMQKCLDNGVPSLGHDICSLVLLPDSSRPDVLRNAKEAMEFSSHLVIDLSMVLVERYLAANIGLSSPVGILWAWYLKAHLLEMCGDVKNALNSIEESIKHTPTAIDMLAKKARLLKKLGLLADAAITMDECRALDLQDRYLNNKATKYFLRANEVHLAMNTISMFTKHEGDPQKALFDLQCSWYEIELAESYARQKKWGLALKKFNAIKSHFLEQYDDLFDFHGYCIRKTTLRAYLNIMDVQDKSFAHKTFQRAIQGVLSIYLHLLDFPEDIDGLGHLSPAERKKERSKLKKKKLKEDDAAKVVAEDDKTDQDPEGDLLLQKDFLSESNSWCSYLQNRLSLCEGKTLALIAEIMFRRGKHLQGYRTLSIGLKKDANNPEVKTCFVKYAMKWKNKKFVGVNPVIANLLKTEMHSVLESDSLAGIVDFVDKYVHRTMAMKSLRHVLAAIKCLNYVEKGNHNRVGEVVASISEQQEYFLCIRDVIETIKFFEVTYEKEEFWKVFVTAATSYFPSADYSTGKKYLGVHEHDESVEDQEPSPL